MGIPDFHSLLRPLLAYAGDGAEKNIREAFDALARDLNLTDDERAKPVPSGKQSLFENRVHWARTYLDKAGLIERTRRSHFRVTARGLETLAASPTTLTVEDLQRFEAFRAFRGPRVADPQAPAPPLNSPCPLEITPEEAIALAEAQILESLYADLLDRVLDMSPVFFEQLVVDLLVAMGYGGTKVGLAQRLGRSHDEGIDGVVNQDPLGLDVVYIQAKRYAPDRSVGRESIQQFIGALVGQGAHRGVFFTTSAFTRTAQDYAQKVPQRVILVDGAALSRLMVEHGVGVRTERSIALRRTDLDYFDVASD